MPDVSRRTFLGTTLAMTTLAAADYRIVDSHVHTWKHDPEFPFAQGANVPERDAAPETRFMPDVSRRTFLGTTLAMTTLAAADYRIVDSHVHTWKHDPEFPRVY